MRGKSFVALLLLPIGGARSSDLARLRTTTMPVVAPHGLKHSGVTLFA